MQAVRGRINARRVAQVAIVALLLALIRSLAQYFWLRHLRGSALRLMEVEPYITGGIVAALGTVTASIAYFIGRYRLAGAVVGATIVGMLLYKMIVIGWVP